MTRGIALPEAPARPDNTLGWIGFLRLGLVQASIGAIVIFATASLGRIMVIEYALPALVPGALVALHYGVQLLRPRWGFDSDIGGRRTPWIIGGLAVLALGNVAAAIATTALQASFGLALAAAVLAYLLIGTGVGAAGTSLLTLLAKQVSARHRAPAATIVWIMMITGFIATAAIAGTMLDPFSPQRLVAVAAAISAGALLVTIGAVWNIEPPAHAVAPVPAKPVKRAFRTAVRDVWTEARTRRFTLFIFLSMLAYSAQELILEPFAGFVFGLTPGASAKLSGVQHAGLLAGMILVAAAGYLFAGRPAGSMRLWTVSGCAASTVAVLGIAGAGLAGAPLAMRACVFCLGVANGAFSIAAIGAMMQLAGTGKPGLEGTRMGLWGAAQAIAFSLGGLTASAASDVTRHVFGSPVHAYAAVFVGEAVLFLVAAAVARTVFSALVRPEKASRFQQTTTMGDHVHDRA